MFEETKEKFLDESSINSKTLNEAGSLNYKLEGLKSTNPDYKLVVDAVNPIKTFLIFNKANVDLNKVNPTDNSRYEFDKFVRLNLLLLQGTKRSASKGILKEGFRPPTGG